MNDIEKYILNQMWIYTTALKTLYWLGVYNKFKFRKFNLRLTDCKIYRYEPFCQTRL